MQRDLNTMDSLARKSNDEYMRYKLFCYYNCVTELYDRSLTNLRSKHDPTEAYITGHVRCLSSAFAARKYKFICKIAEENKIEILGTGNKYHLSAQGWIDEYKRLADNGEMDFILKKEKDGRSGTN